MRIRKDKTCFNVTSTVNMLVNLNFYGSILLLTSDFNLLFSLSINSNFLFNEANSFSNKNDLF